MRGIHMSEMIKHGKDKVTPTESDKQECRAGF